MFKDQFFRKAPETRYVVGKGGLMNAIYLTMKVTSTHCQ
jgi:hypothetical protein